MHPRPHPRTLLAPALAATALLAACAGSGPTEMDLPPGAFPAAFNAAKDTLRGQRFVLNRVDGQAGVITTEPRTGAGLFTPWDLRGADADDALDDTLNRQQRTVRITFEPALPPPTDTPGPALDPDTSPGPDPLAASPTRMVIEVVIERLERPMWRTTGTDINLASYAIDPALVDRGLQPEYAVARSRDAALAARLLAKIAAAIETGPD